VLDEAMIKKGERQKMSGEGERQPRLTEIGQGTVIRLSMVLLVVGAVSAFFLQLGGIKEQISQISGSGIEKRLTTIEVTNLNIERRLMTIEAEIKVLSAPRRALFPQHLWPTSGGTESRSSPLPGFLKQQHLPLSTSNLGPTYPP
jgi:hypothetical protein